MSRALGISEEELAGRLEPWLQERLGSGTQLRSVRIPDNGASNLTGVIEIGPGPRRLVLRTVSLSADQLYETYDLEKQYRVMDRLAQTGIKVPKLLAFEADPTVFGREFYVMFDTGGRAVPEQPSYHQSGWFADASPEEQRGVWFGGIDAIASVHNLDWVGLDLDFVAPTEPGRDMNERWLHRHSNHLRWMERRNDRTYPRLRQVFDWLEDNFPPSTPTGLLWADAKLGNLMIANSEIVGVLDWEHCTIGPLLYDLANWMVFDRLMSSGAGVERLAALPSRTETIARYESATGRPTADVEYFELLSAVRLANVVCGMAPGLIASGRFPEHFADHNAGTIAMESQLASMGLEL
jgi:aminoglycoside phosphotransferase (APT) family kinase protein